MRQIDQLKLMAVFVHVVDCGSMRAAAKQLQMTPAAVSQHLANLEQQLAVSLLHRSTRRMNLTEAGEAYYRHCSKMVAAAGEATNAIQMITERIEGELRIAAPVGVASALLSETLKPLMDSNPGLSLTVLASDTRIDLVANQIDIAIRAGTPTESSYILHRLGQNDYRLFASPDYLQQAGQPISPEDLSRFSWLSLAAYEGSDRILLRQSNGKEQEVRVTIRAKFDNLTVMTHYALAGYGVCLLPAAQMRHRLERGELVMLLPEWQGHQSEFYALTPSRQMSRKVKLALQSLQDRFSQKYWVY